MAGIAKRKSKRTMEEIEGKGTIEPENFLLEIIVVFVFRIYLIEDSSFVDTRFEVSIFDLRIEVFCEWLFWCS